MALEGWIVFAVCNDDNGTSAPLERVEFNVSGVEDGPFFGFPDSDLVGCAAVSGQGRSCHGQHDNKTNHFQRGGVHVCVSVPGKYMPVSRKSKG